MTYTSGILRPLTLKTLHLRNRAVMAPMTRNRSKNHIPGPDVAQYYQRRAEGEIGLIITEGTTVGHPASNGYPDVPDFHTQEALEGWRHVVEEVHKSGGKIFPQLWHVGSVRQTHLCYNEGVDNPKATCCKESQTPGYAPSPVPHPYVEGAEVPHEMTFRDIQEVIQAFVKAAQDAKAMGFDGVEIHGAHGYLIDQFFWSRTNQRGDEYGGEKLSKMVRFAVELIGAVRNAVGPDFPIDFRFSQWKLGDYSAKLAQTPQELEAFLIPIVEAGVDIFHCSTRRFWDPEFPNSSLNLAGWTKKITGKTVISVGSVGLDNDFINTLKMGAKTQASDSRLKALNECLENKEIDLIAIGRSLLADPFWLKKHIEDRSNEVKPFSNEALDKYY
ncbi:MAG: NADH oxidase [Chlamydiae bacterium]|nr:NADH oxidase [Chlamydiota bacterium]